MCIQYYKVISIVRAKNQGTWILVQYTIPYITHCIGLMPMCGGKMRKQETI